MADPVVIELVTPTPINVSLTGPQPVSVTMALVGPQGPAGTQGPPGPIGPEGPAGPAGFGKPFQYSQAVPSSSWTVPHNLGYVPASVSVYDTNGNLVETGVVIVDENTLVITMASEMAGTVEVI